MIKKLREKFIIITMLSLLAVLGGIMFAINIINYTTINSNADEILTIISQNHGEFPKDTDLDEPEQRGRGHHNNISPETPFETRFFSVIVDKNGNITHVNTNFISAVTPDQAVQFSKQALAIGKQKGNISIYRYMITDYMGGKMVVFMDCGRQLSTADSFLMASLSISIAGLVLVFMLVLIFSRRAVKPIAESYQKQKRFITDSSHELKTPLAVISANVEVLEAENGSNEWTESIKKQINYLSRLAASLTSLARMYENHTNIERTKFSLSEAVADTVQQFSVIAKTKEKDLTTSINDGIDYFGNEEMLRRLISILMDNAIKYSKNAIYVYLSRHKRKIILEFFNNTDEALKGNLNDYFDRFYRADSSRARETGGCGIGLSTAKAIVEAHNGRITAKSEGDRSIRFTITL